jgi:hypothetical protein
VAEKDLSKPTAMNLWVKPDARRVIDALATRTQMPATDLVARVLEWFSSLDQKLQISVLWKDEAVQQEMMTALAWQMAGESPPSADDVPGGTSPDAAARSIQLAARSVQAMALKMLDWDNQRREYIAKLEDQVEELKKGREAGKGKK